MSYIDRASTLLPEVTKWRRHLHQFPELGYEEVKTAAFVAQRLREMGLDPVEGIAKTGVVASLKRGSGNRMIALRADFDALPITETNDFDHRSSHPGVMHACGHDGHTAMLLGAAKALSDPDGPEFDGTVVFVFQPAEEGGGGGRVMVEEGLFERFDADEVYGLHNDPSLPLGRIDMRSGPVMASADEFSIVIRGAGGHAALPHTTKDPVPVAAQIISAAQTLTAREIDPLDSIVLSITMVLADGGSPNIIPGEVTLRGTVRSLRLESRDRTFSRLEQIATSIAAGFDQTAELHIDYGYPVTVNSTTETVFAADAARAVVGEDAVNDACPPMMAAEDFAYMLHERPGSYVFLGNGDGGGTGSANLHSAGYDFNDDAIPFGISFWVELVQQRLPAKAS